MIVALTLPPHPHHSLPPQIGGECGGEILDDLILSLGIGQMASG